MRKTNILGRIIKSKGKIFTVFDGKNQFECQPRGSILLKDKILIGDIVKFDDCVIESICERKNFFLRPNIANVDCVNIVICPIPKPDFLLVDKMLVELNKKGVKVIITVNKKDLGVDLYNYVINNYSNAVDKIFNISANDKESIDLLKNEIKGKFTAFVGQSAVGKTSLCNLIFGCDLKVGNLSEKLNRGKNTTTSKEIHFNDDFYIFDTPGFSSFDCNVSANDLSKYYREFLPYNDKCYYIACSHTHEPDCLIKEKVNENIISKDRYERYLIIYKELKENEKRKH